MTRTPCHDEHGRGAPMLIGAHISQVASSTPFPCCSRFSPIAFNLSNTKSSLYVFPSPAVPFGVSNHVHIQTRSSPYMTLALFALVIFAVRKVKIKFDLGSH